MPSGDGVTEEGAYKHLVDLVYLELSLSLEGSSLLLEHSITLSDPLDLRLFAVLSNDLRT